MIECLVKYTEVDWVDRKIAEMVHHYEADSNDDNQRQFTKEEVIENIKKSNKGELTSTLNRAFNAGRKFERKFPELALLDVQKQED